MAHIFAFCFTPLHFNNAFYKLEKNQFRCLSLSYPEDLKKQWLPFSSSLFSLSSFPLASLPSLLALLINSLSSYDKHFMFHSVSLFSQAPLARGSRALPSVFLPARASEQGNVVSVYIYIYIYIVIERTRDLIYLKFVATDFFRKIISPSAGENSGDLA